MHPRPVFTIKKRTYQSINRTQHKMEPNSFIDLKIISCKDINAFNFFQKLTLYAQVSISTTNPKTKLTKQKQRTPTHRDTDDDGTNPEWNHQTRFNLSFLSSHPDPSEFFLSFEFRHDGLILGNKFLGECRVPLTDLIRDIDGAERFVSYEIRCDGKSNGIFHFSYRLTGIGNTNSSQILDGRISGYPVLTPDDCAPVQYHVPEIERPYPYCYPPVCEGPFAVRPPPLIGGCNYYEYNFYPPPQPSVYPPPPVEPEAHHWQSGPYFENRW